MLQITARKIILRAFGFFIYLLNLPYKTVYDDIIVVLHSTFLSQQISVWVSNAAENPPTFHKTRKPAFQESELCVNYII